MTHTFQLLSCVGTYSFAIVFLFLALWVCSRFLLQISILQLHAGNKTVLAFIKNKTSSILLHFPFYIPFHFPLHVPCSNFHVPISNIPLHVPISMFQFLIFQCMFQFPCSIACSNFHVPLQVPFRVPCSIPGFSNRLLLTTFGNL